KYLTWVVGVPALLKEEYFHGSEKHPTAIESAKHLEPDVVEEQWPAFLYTEEETNPLLLLENDIHKFADEMRDKFISGSEPLENWDEYVETIEQMGLSEYLDIQNAAYERYKSN